MNGMNKLKVTGILFFALILLAPAGLFAQDEASSDTPGRDQLEILYYKWIHNDIIRNIEEIKRARDQTERRDMVEDIEQIIYDKIEFPLSYKQAEISDSFDLDRIGYTSDVTEGKEASPVAPEIAEAYALLGVAKGFEGFGAAANDLFEKAKKIYSNVMSTTVSLDHNDDNRTLSSWIAASRSYWGNATATRVTFYGKRIQQEVVDQLNSDNVNIVRMKKNPTYTEFVATRDFVNGMKRYIATDDTLRERKPNKFSIYLPPGNYMIQTQISSGATTPFRISNNSEENNFIVETLADGVAIYPIPDIRVFEQEMKKLQQKDRFGDDLLPPDAGTGAGDEILEETLPEPEEEPLD